MRRFVYETISGLPTKILMIGLAFIAILVTAWPEPFRAWVATNMTLEQIRLYGAIALCALVLYLCLMAWIRPKDDNVSSSVHLEASVHGAQNVGHVNGDVHFHSSATQDRETAGWTSNGLENFRQAIVGAAVARDESRYRNDLIHRLTLQFMASHDGVSSRMMAGLELPPIEFLNLELERMKEPWRIKSIKGSYAETLDIEPNSGSIA